MLTVIREMAAAAERLPDDAPLQDALTAVLASGRIAVEHTTRQLAALRQAGVVDAGGYGLLVIYRGIIRALLEHQRPRPEARQLKERRRPPRASPRRPRTRPTELSRYRYCTSFLVQGEELPRERLEELLAPLGDSLLMVGDERMLKVHVHTDDPGVVLSHATTYGTISEVEINDMHKQTRERDERLAARRPRDRQCRGRRGGRRGQQTALPRSGLRRHSRRGTVHEPQRRPAPRCRRAARRPDVIVLPNNGNVVLTAEQAAGMSARNIVVVPSTSMPAGLAAMIDVRPGSRRGHQRADHGTRASGPATAPR